MIELWEWIAIIGSLITAAAAVVYAWHDVQRSDRAIGDVRSRLEELADRVASLAARVEIVEDRDDWEDRIGRRVLRAWAESQEGGDDDEDE